MNYEQQRYSD